MSFGPAPLRGLLRRPSSGHVVSMSALRRLGQALDGLDGRTEPSDLARLVYPFDTQGAERLEVLDRDLRPGGTPGRWSGVDVFRAIDPSSIANAVRNTAFESTILAVLEVLRNILVLVPVLLTWWGLRYAADAYASAMRNPALHEQSFLLLWQNHFGRPGPYTWTQPTLSDIATWDVAVLILILGATLLIHAGLNVVQARREAVARVLERELQHAVWKAAGSLAQATTLPAAVLEFRAASQNLLDELAGYNQQITVLAEARQIEVDGLLRFGQELRQTIGGLNGFHQDVSAMLAGARAIATTLSDQLAELTSQQNVLASGLRSVGAQMSLHNQAYGTAADQLNSTGGLLADAAEQNLTAIADLGRQVGQFSADFADLRDHLAHEHGVLEGAIRSLATATGAMVGSRDRGDGVSGDPRREIEAREAVAPQLAVVQAQLQAAMSALAAGVQSISSTLGAADARVSGSSTSFERSAAALSAATQNLNTTLGGVHRGLADSAASLGRASEAFQGTLPAIRSLNPVNLEAAANALSRAMTSAEARQVAATSAIEEAAGALRDLARAIQSRSVPNPSSGPTRPLVGSD